MSRLSTTLHELRSKKETALICYITAGDPDQSKTVEIACALAEAGVDALEIGIPFSDPLADGPSIQAASQRALEAGMTVHKTLEVVRAVRARKPAFPLILMTYYNPILHYGLEKYASEAAAAGADAHIVTDLTPEEAERWKLASIENKLDTIFLVAPTSTPERIKAVSKLCSGFIYCVSRTGVTGAREDVPAELADTVGRIRQHSDLPICIGFGISQPQHVKKIGAFADGVVVGSSLVNLIHEHRNSSDLLSSVREYCETLKLATGSTKA